MEGTLNDRLVHEFTSDSAPCTYDFVSSHPAWFQSAIRHTELIPGAVVTQQILNDAEHWMKPNASALAFATALEHGHQSGSTEPWIQYLVCALLLSLQRKDATVLECGGFIGKTSSRLATTLEALGGGTLIVAEWDPDAPERADLTQAALEATRCPNVQWTVRREDALSVIRSLPDESLDYVFLDDDHSHQHVDEEIRLVYPKVRTGGLITGHDVWGSCALHEEFERYGGYALDLPRLGAAGGLGILQCR